MKGRVALVTGANAGLGLATTRALAARGAEVTRRASKEMRGAARELEAAAHLAHGAAVAEVDDVLLEPRWSDVVPSW